MLMKLIHKDSFNRLALFSSVIFLSCVLFPTRSQADVESSGFDPRDCVCISIREAPIDIFTARSVSTPFGNHLEVVEILTHGIPERQVPGEIITDLTNFYGDSENTGYFLVYAGARAVGFFGVSIPSLDIDAVQLRTLITRVQPNSNYDRYCKTDFTLTQLKVFAEALAADEGTCHALATKYLGIPKPPPEPSDSMLQCGGGTSPGWLVSILGALGLLACRARRRRPAER